MKLSDLYAAEIAQEDRAFVVLRSDFSPSENRITLVDPAGEKAAKAAFMFDAAIRRKVKKYEESHKELQAECEEAGDFLEYNLGLELECKTLRDAFCHEIVEGWDFSDEFTPENLQAALDAFRAPVLASLQRQIINQFRAMNEAHSGKF
jgi:sugar phosphate isomerase/epimerase